MTEISILLLLLVANGAPIILRNLLHDRVSYPVDGGMTLADGHRVFGRSKTLRGIVAAVLLTAAVAPLLGWSWETGALTGAYAMLGDLFSSFCKRRLGMPSSSRAIGLDQLPESVLPLFMLRERLGLDWQSALLVVLAFMVTELALSRLLYRLRIRNKPY